MTRALPRSHFNRSRLSHVLERLGLVDTAVGPAGVARLGEWLNAADAMRLYAALDGDVGRGLAASSAPAAPAGLARECTRLRVVLAQGIENSFISGGGTRIRFPWPDPAAPDEAAAYEPYRRFQLAHQREMEAAIAPLRARARTALALSGPALAKLAALDTALGGILAGREAKLLATLPALLERRFVQLRDARRQALTAAGQADDRAAWLIPGGWLARFGDELRAMLLAELDLRLQPLTGLIDALPHEVSPQ